MGGKGWMGMREGASGWYVCSCIWDGKIWDFLGSTELK